LIHSDRGFRASLQKVDLFGNSKLNQWTTAGIKPLWVTARIGSIINPTICAIVSAEPGTASAIDGIPAVRAHLRNCGIATPTPKIHSSVAA
jgi:hypothetical protein